MVLKQDFKIGDKIRVLSGGEPLDTVVDDIRWSMQGSDWEYMFKDENGKTWSEVSAAIELIK